MFQRRRIALRKKRQIRSKETVTEYPKLLALCKKKLNSLDHRGLLELKAPADLVYLQENKFVLMNNTYARARQFISRAHARLVPKESSIDDHLWELKGALKGISSVVEGPNPISNNPKLNEEGTLIGLEEMRDNADQSAESDRNEI